MKLLVGACAVAAISVAAFYLLYEHDTVSESPAAPKAAAIAEASLPPLTAVLPTQASSRPALLIQAETPQPTNPAWKALNTKGKTLAQLSHEAAVSGKLTDAMAAQSLRRTCFFVGTTVSHQDSLNLLTQTQRDETARLKQQCESGWYGGRKIVVRDQIGYRGDTAELLDAAWNKKPKDETAREEMLKFIKEQKSAALLQSLFNVVSDRSFLEKLGLDMEKGRPFAADRELFRLAVDIRACQELGTCQVAAIQQFSCNPLKECVSDLREYPDKHIFGSLESRGVFWRGRPDLSPENLRARWQRVNNVVSALIGG